MWVRGLKPAYDKLITELQVAPHVGAWIETPTQQLGWTYYKSHPMWVRGLKQPAHRTEEDSQASHPMWVRGLKPQGALSVLLAGWVAPHVGAWIETLSSYYGQRTKGRTPCGCVD